MAKKTLARMDIMEVCLKVKKNENGVLPTNIHLPSTTKELIYVHVDPFFEVLPHIGYLIDKHGENLAGAWSLEYGSTQSHFPYTKDSYLTYD